MKMSLVEEVAADGKVLCLIIRGDAQPERTTFLTPDTYNLQAGFIVYPAGGAVVPHRHHPVERRIQGTQEVLMVRRGHCLVDLYDESKTLVATRDLAQGDVILLVSGGHGFRMTQDTVLLEIKQGPYVGVEEKERFTP